MQAIATLIQDDPYLKMPRGERIAARARRRAMFRSEPIGPAAPIVVLGVQMPPEQPESPKDWLMRQIQNAMPSVDQDKIAAVKAAVDTVTSVLRRPMVHDVQMVICHHFGVTVGDLVSKSREKHLAIPRHYALYLSYMLCGRSMPDLGRRFGCRDHTSILHSVHKIRDQRVSDPAIEAIVQALASAIEARTQ